MATTVKQSKRKAVKAVRRAVLHVYVLEQDRRLVERAAQRQRRSISSYLESIIVPQAQKDAEGR